MAEHSIKSSDFFFIAKTFQGLEEVLATELDALGAQEIQILKRAVAFRGDKLLMYRANMFLRSAIRILQSVRNFEATNEQQLYDQIYRIPWEKYMDKDQLFAIDTIIGSHFFNNSHFVALKSKDAIVDRFRNKYRARPSIDLQNPDVRIHINIQGKYVRVYLDSSGSSLHLRGYRKAMTKAPLNEVLAAGMILMAGWDGKTPFLDPMCGSATMPIEAAMIASDTAPGLSRKSFGFFNWRDYDDTCWQQVVDEALEREKELDIPIFASDISPTSLKIAEQNLLSAGFDKAVKLDKVAFQKREVPAEKGFLIVNPPYDQRLLHNDIEGFYKEIGDQLKQAYKGWEAWIISSNMGAMKKIGLKASKKIQLFNGSLSCKFQGYELY